MKRLSLSISSKVFSGRFHRLKVAVTISIPVSASIVGIAFAKSLLVGTGSTQIHSLMIFNRGGSRKEHLGTCGVHRNSQEG